MVSVLTVKKIERDNGQKTHPSLNIFRMGMLRSLQERGRNEDKILGEGRSTLQEEKHLEFSEGKNTKNPVTSCHTNQDIRELHKGGGS